MKNDKIELQEHHPADTFLALSTIFVSCISGIFLGLYWRVLFLFLRFDFN